MTLQELYQLIGGSYERATSVLRVEKLIDKHIRKFPNGGVGDALIKAGETMDPVQLFETSHAMKGVCANLGLLELSERASEISEEFRPGKSRRFSDEEVRAKLLELKELYNKTVEGIRKYSEG